MTLNLLLSHTPSEVKDLLELSFAAFQDRGKEDTLRRRWDQFVSELRKILPRGKCDITDPYEVLENIQKRSELCEEIKKLSYRITKNSLEDALAVYLTPGRLFVHKNKRIYVVFRVFREHGRLICAAHSIKSIRHARKRRMRPRRVELSQIGAICDYCVDIPEDYSSGRLVRLFDSVPLDQVKILPIEIQNQEFRPEELEEIQRKIDTLPCETCEHFKTCHKRKRGPLPKLLKDFRSLAVQMEGREGGLWPSFKRHMRFLQETGFVDQTNRLTFDGYWASKLRLDQPLLIAEAIRSGALNGVSAEVLTGGLATFVWDKPLEIALAVNGVFNLAELEKSFNGILDHIEGVRARKIRRGFESPPIMFWPCVALSLWAKNVPWDRLLTFVPIDEGDMASLITRTADHLRQVTNLAETHPQLAALAEQAIRLIQREPVYIP
jgi:superfamily II RNA helicase